MACSNASGTLKLPLVLIGKSAKPRAIKNLKTLPVYYKSQKSAWMTSALFKEWFEKEFVPVVSEFLAEKGLKKAVLFVDNCAAHPSLTKGNISVRFFPPNTTCLLQPMDQGCLQNLKLFYRSNLMAHVIDSVNNGSSLLDSLKAISIKEVIFWIADAWNKVLPNTIRKSWMTLWPLNSISQPEGTPSSDESRGAASGTEILDEFCDVMRNRGNLPNVQIDDVRSWFHSQNTLSPNDILTDEEIIDIINEDRNLENV
ncbi:GSCOCG00004380001-RA-CDS, partial [Cotesia congregata]